MTTRVAKSFFLRRLAGLFFEKDTWRKYLAVRGSTRSVMGLTWVCCLGSSSSWMGNWTPKYKVYFALKLFKSGPKILEFNTKRLDRLLREKFEEIGFEFLRTDMKWLIRGPDNTVCFKKAAASLVNLPGLIYDRLFCVLSKSKGTSISQVHYQPCCLHSQSTCQTHLLRRSLTIVP